MLKYLFILFLFGCSPMHHFKKVATTANVTPAMKAVIAPKVAILFPTQTKYLPGEVITRIDTVIDLDETLRFAAALDSLIYLMGSSDSTDTDSLTTAIVRRFKPGVIRTVQIRIDTVVVPETAKIYGLLHDLEVCETTNAALVTTNDAYMVRNAELHKGRNKWLWYFIAACVALAGSIILHFKR